MNDPRAFDDIARQKLAEREFAFEQADWTAMRGLLDDQPKKRPVPVWWITGALLLAVPATWWMLREDAPVAAAPEVAIVQSASLPQADVQPVPVATTDTDQQANANKVPEEVASISSEHFSPNPISQPHAKTRTESRVAGSTLTSTTRPSTKISETPVRSIAVTGTGVVAATVDVPPQQQPSDDRPAEGALVPAVANGSEGSLDEAPAATAVAPDETPAPPTPEPNDTSAGKTVFPASSTAEPLADAEPVQDTAIAAPTPPPATTWVATSTTHWELSALGGSMRSTSGYSGSNSADWNSGITGLWSLDVGAEVAHMGEHLGFGFGVHHTSYSEQLRAEALTSTTENYENIYTLTPTEMHLMVVVTDTIIGGIIYYQTDTVNTTINVLTWVTDTTQVTTTLREAREEVTMVDYWEVPLFADMHTAKGRWSFGVRGGPMIGLLSAKRGAVPNAEDDGYADLGDQAFREMTFGYTARAYVRYRIATNWSLGLEPTIKGHFGNALDGGDLVRRNSAVGALFSLNYRLP